MIILYDNRNNYYGSQILVFDERRKPECPGKNLSEQSTRVSCFFTHMALRPGSKLGHIGGRQVLLLLCQSGAQCWHGSGFKETLLS